MGLLPVLAGAAIAGLLALSCLARPPRRPPDPAAWSVAVAVVVGLYAAAAVLAAGGGREPALWCAAAGAALSAWIHWVLRGGCGPENGEDEEPGPEDGGGPGGGLQADWDRFDRERASWEAQDRQPAGVA